jgi:hypothetical protein
MAMTGEVRVRIGGAVLGALVACAPLASAGQEAAVPPRPFRAGSEATGPRRALTFDVAVHEAIGQMEDGQADGYSTNARLNGAFTARARKVKFDVAGGTEYRYYAGSSTVADQGRHGRIGLEASGRTTRFTVAQTVRQLPFQQLVGLPSILGEEGIVDTSADHALNRVPNTVYGTSVAVHRTLGRDGSLMFDYDLGMSRVAGGSGSHDVHRGGGLFTQRLGRSLDLRLGYHARSRQPGPDATLRPLLTHDLDAGFAFTRGLSLTRRTNLMFTSGSSILTSDLGRQYVLTGSAALNHMIGRTWNASLTFDRGVEFPDALPQPVVSDRVTVGIGGLWGRRMTLRARATGGIGNTTLDAAGQYRTFGAELRAAVLVGRRWHWFAEPFYFRHDASGVALIAGVPAATSRLGVRTGLDVQLAFLDRRRR